MATREQLIDLVQAIPRANAAELRALYRQADEQRALAATVDANGTTVETLLWNRRTDLERARSL